MLCIRRPPHNFDTYPSPVSSNSIFINALLLKLTSNQLWNNPPCTPLVQNSNLQMELWDQIDSLHCCSCNTLLKSLCIWIDRSKEPNKSQSSGFLYAISGEKGLHRSRHDICQAYLLTLRNLPEENA